MRFSASRGCSGEEDGGARACCWGFGAKRNPRACVRACRRQRASSATLAPPLPPPPPNPPLCAAAPSPTSSMSCSRDARSQRWCGARGGGATPSPTRGTTCRVRGGGGSAGGVLGGGVAAAAFGGVLLLLLAAAAAAAAAGRSRCTAHRPRPRRRHGRHAQGGHARARVRRQGGAGAREHRCVGWVIVWVVLLGLRSRRVGAAHKSCRPRAPPSHPPAHPPPRAPPLPSAREPGARAAAGGGNASRVYGQAA